MEVRVFSDVKVHIKTEDILKNNVIYLLTFPSNKVYIGKTTTTLKERIKEHIKEAFKRTNCSHYPKCRAIRKYQTFTVEVLFEGTAEELSDKEIEYISNYNSTADKFGYNLSAGGGSLGRECSPETRKKISESNKGNIPHNRKIVQQFDLSGNMIQEFESIQSAINFLGVKSTKIYSIIDKDKVYHKSIWKTKKIIN